MTNQELFKNYGTERWVVEENLCFLLQLYWDDVQKQYKDKPIGTKLPINPVSFVKKFMKEETICEVEYAEKSKMDTLKSKEVVTIDANFVE